MTSLLEWLLNLDNIRLGHDAPLRLMWAGEMRAWVLLCCAMVAVAGVVLVYRRERTTMRRKIVLAGIRCGLIALIGAVLCGPVLVLQRTRVEPSFVTLLIDRSLSMNTRDIYEDADLARAVAEGAGLANTGRLADRSRLELVQAALSRNSAAPLARLLEHNELQIAAFDSGMDVLALATSSEALPVVRTAVETVAADGMRTDLGSALHTVIQKAAGKRLAAVVVVSDGQSTEMSGLDDALDLARGRKVPVLTLRIGSPHRRRDIAIGALRAESAVFLNDPLTVEVPISATGLAQPTPIVVEMIDEPSGDVVASQRVTIDPGVPTLSVELRLKASRAGPSTYRVAVRPLPGEVNVKNNDERVTVSVMDAPLRVLYVDGYPRYEYRYLKNALLRESTMQLSVLLLEADERFVQEGTEPIRRFPETPEELNRFDVVLFGDVDPRAGWLTHAQMEMLLSFVGRRGGGFGLIAGERAAPHRYRGTPLEKLIPIRIDPRFLGHYDEPLTSGFRPQFTSAGLRSGLLHSENYPSSAEGEAAIPLSHEAASSPASSSDLLASLPELYWMARTLGPRPGATVLAEHPTSRGALPMGFGANDALRPQLMPLLVMGRYGAGKLFFQATDDTWRWRRHRVGGTPAGEWLHDTYWVKIIRMLAQPQRYGEDRRLTLRTDRRVYGYGTPARVQIEVFDVELLEEFGETIPLVVYARTDDLDPATPNAGGEDWFPLVRFDAHRIGKEATRYEGVVVTPDPGSFLIGLADREERGGASVSIRVERPDLETRRLEADHDTLERMAAATGGRVVELNELETAFAGIRDHSFRIPDDITEPLWDSRLVLALFILMISMEWGLRKVFGLL